MATRTQCMMLAAVLILCALAGCCPYERRRQTAKVFAKGAGWKLIAQDIRYPEGMPGYAVLVDWELHEMLDGKRFIWGERVGLFRYGHGVGVRPERVNLVKGDPPSAPASQPPSR